MVTIITSIITCLSPIIVAYFGYITTRQQKQTKEFIDLQTRFNAQNDVLKNRELEDQKAAIESIQESVKSLTTQMSDLQQTVDLNKIDRQLENILEISHVNFEYSQSLSQVICAIGDCIESAQINDAQANRFKDELERHQSEERKYVNRIFKVAY